jgi:hypothetical protein
MRRFCIGLAILTLFTMTAAAQAQDDVLKEKLKMDVERLLVHSKIVGVAGAAMGGTVRNAPYSAVEVSESSQTLADGTRIRNERKTSVYRDSEGRVRRETPQQITIWDPVANVSYFLDPKTQTATKTTMMRSVAIARSESSGPPSAGARFNYEVRSHNGEVSAVVNGQPVDPSTIKLRAPLGEAEAMALDHLKWVEYAPGAASPELQTVVMTRRSDPRSGEETFRLTNINRGDPPAYLFQVPPEYKLNDRK